MAVRANWSMLLACALGAGGGCDATVEPLRNPEDCPTLPIRPLVEDAEEKPEDLMISDFDADMSTASLPTPLLNRYQGRDGAWVAGVAASSISYTAERSSDCPGRGGYAGHFAVENFVSWGVNWTASFRREATTASGSSLAVAYDGRAYSGVSFWAALPPRGPRPAAGTVRVGISTMDTAWNGGICVAPNCSDHYFTTIPINLESRWQRFEAPFATMEQMGYGDPEVPTMRKDQMVGFVIWPTQVFDLWVDDIRFMP